MTDIKKVMSRDIEIPEELRKKFWDGGWNRSVRHYFYITKGLALFNDFRYIVMSIAIVYAFLKLNNFWFFPLMFVACIPPLDFFGWLSVHKMDRITEFLHIRYATHYSHYNVELNENQVKYLKEILELLKERNG